VTFNSASVHAAAPAAAAVVALVLAPAAVDPASVEPPVAALVTPPVTPPLTAGVAAGPVPVLTGGWVLDVHPPNATAAPATAAITPAFAYLLVRIAFIARIRNPFLPLRNGRLPAVEKKDGAGRERLTDFFPGAHHS
jgi:hypothetical protein